MNFKIFYLNFNLMKKYNKKNKDIKNKKLSTDNKLIYSIIKHINSNDYLELNLIIIIININLKIY